MEIKRILWPTDFSRAAAMAEEYVAMLSQKHQAEVHLLHVAEDLTQFESYWGGGPDRQHIADLNQYAMKIARQRLEDLCKNKLTGCPRYEIHILLGDPAREILTTIRAIHADLVIMATHGMKANFPFGSVAERIVRNSPVPVLTINPAR